MNTKSIVAVSIAVLLSVPVSAAFAQGNSPGSKDQMQSPMQERAGAQMRDRDGQPMMGHGLMTPEEREQYRDRMRSMNSAEERQAFREQHHQRMVERARAQGLDPETVGDLPATAAGDQRRQMQEREGMDPKGKMNQKGGMEQRQNMGPDMNRQRSGEGMPRTNPPGGVQQ
ncbi:MAG: hypothetical protein JJ867_13185 [Marinobacter sp.]|nr:hypothetical protein [Marinobacter sp.]